MAESALNVKELPLEKDKIANTQECIRNIQELQNVISSQVDLEIFLLHIKAVIDKELCQTDDASHMQYNQVVLNVAFRCYYRLLRKNNLDDRFYGKLIEDNFMNNLFINEKNFIILQCILLTNPSLIQNPKDLLEKLLQALVLAIDLNHIALLAILKALNLLQKKFPKMELDVHMSLEHIYFCLQCNQMGMRDECMTLLQHICSNREQALSYFQCIVNYWPWTNRYKLFILGSILNNNSLDVLLIGIPLSKDDFFMGLRSTLNYKNLFAPSQYIIKALSSQKSLDLLEVSVNILTLGSKKEIQNFYAQWFSRIQQKDELFDMLQQKPEIALFIENSSDYLMDKEHSYRLILIFSMFAKHVFQLSKLHFFKLSTELLTNCFQYDIDCQLLIFKFIVDNLANFALEDCMEFVELFLKTHSSVDTAQFRNTMLSKMPNIINYISKTYCRLCTSTAQISSLESSILNFFIHLQEDIDCGIASDLYQPKIFYLTLLEILVKSLYMESVFRNAKNCCVSQNQQLGLFLKAHKVFDDKVMAMRLLKLLNDPCGFDDALDSIVAVIKLIRPQEVIINLALDLSQGACILADVDKCNLCVLYTRVAVQNCQDDIILYEFLNITIANLQENFRHFDKDPLMSCKSHGHLFGLLNVIYELTENRAEICAPEFIKILGLVEEIEKMVIKKLNVSVLENAETILTAASFEDMDKSLEILVSQSAYNKENHELCRKYLLMSFWLTLKACCDLASSMACYEVKLATPSPKRCSFLQKCLEINVVVLTKCRHKGAIEAAGVSIGKLTKSITSYLGENTAEYNLLHLCLEQQYQVQDSNVSTTRRGAGFSLMFLHIVKNEEHRGRPILKRAVKNLLNPPAKTSNGNDGLNYDRLEALYLHFLCVLVRDTELRESMTKYYNEIMMAAVNHIDNPEWTICNAALQLFGALVPKIVGQKHANEFENPLLWETSDVTFSEINRKLPKACVHIVNYCLNEKASTRSIILFLEFLHKVEYIYKGPITHDNPIFDYRELMWSLLKHNAEKVRKLAAKCFVRSHEFRIEIPKILLQITTILFSVSNENFFEGLVYVLQEGILKLRHDSVYIITHPVYQQIEQQMKENLRDTFSWSHLQYKFFTSCKLWDLLKLLGHSDLMGKLKIFAQPQDSLDKMLGYDLWLERINST